MTSNSGCHCSNVKTDLCDDLVEQEQMEEMKKKEERLEKHMAEVMTENKKLTDPLHKANNEVEELRRRVFNYDKDKQLLAVSTHQCARQLFVQPPILACTVGITVTVIWRTEDSVLCSITESLLASDDNW